MAVLVFLPLPLKLKNPDLYSDCSGTTGRSYTDLINFSFQFINVYYLLSLLFIFQNLWGYDFRRDMDVAKDVYGK